MAATEDPSDLDIHRVSAAYLRAVETARPDQLAFARRLLLRLDPELWRLEWCLPWWLGRAFGLDPDIADELVLGNVLGLGSIRLHDDLLDGEVARDEITAARSLTATLIDLSRDPYRRRFAPSSPLWDELWSLMSTWEGAGQAPDRLAARGAPLKICAYAVCLLTSRMDAHPTLDRCLDHALTGLALYDDLGDWREDLQAGRWNAFVAELADRPQRPEFRKRNHASIVAAMMSQDAAALKYVDRICNEMTEAANLANDLGVHPLAAHLIGLAASIANQGTGLQEHYSEVGREASGLFAQAVTRRQ